MSELGPKVLKNKQAKQATKTQRNPMGVGYRDAHFNFLHFFSLLT